MPGKQRVHYQITWLDKQGGEKYARILRGISVEANQ